MTPRLPKPIVGVVGGIGSGKTHVARLLAQDGGLLISGDELGHEVLREPDVVAQVLRRWGAEVLDDHGAVHRRTLGRIVFADPEELRALEEIVFPRIGRRIREEIARAEGDPAVDRIVLDAAVMLEAGWADALDLLVFVEAPAEVRLARVREKRGWDAAELQRRERAQLPLEEKRRRADRIVRNDGNEDHLRQDLAQVLESLGEGRGPLASEKGRSDRGD